MEDQEAAGVLMRLVSMVNQQLTSVIAETVGGRLQLKIYGLLARHQRAPGEVAIIVAALGVLYISASSPKLPRLS